MITKYNGYIIENLEYSEISDEEYMVSKFAKNTLIDIELNNISHILKLLKKLIDDKIIRYYRAVGVPGNTLKLTYEDRNLFSTIDINQLEDEWFLVSTFEQNEFDRTTGIDKYYQCDQLRGLESLLKYKFNLI